MREEKKWKTGIAFVMVIALLAAVILGRNAIFDGNSLDRQGEISEQGVGAVTLSSDGIPDTGAATSRLKAPHIDEVEDVDGLLTELVMTDNIKFLKKAQSLFPDDLDVVILSALWADSADSDWLDKLEALQPNNALPNLMRAFFHAEDADVTRFAEEMKVALSKPDIDTHFKQRLARLQDEMFESGRFPERIFGDGSLDVLDRQFADRQAVISKMFADNRKLFGSEDTANSMGLAWAKELQSMPSLDLLYRNAGLYLEGQILSRYKDGDLYGNGGMTVAVRKEEVMKEMNVNLRKTGRYFELILSNHSNSGSDLILKKQFVSRLRADGEMAAVNWLMSQ